MVKELSQNIEQSNHVWSLNEEIHTFEIKKWAHEIEKKIETSDEVCNKSKSDTSNSKKDDYYFVEKSKLDE